MSRKLQTRIPDFENCDACDDTSVGNFDIVSWKNDLLAFLEPVFQKNEDLHVEAKISVRKQLEKLMNHVHVLKTKNLDLASEQTLLFDEILSKGRSPMKMNVHNLDALKAKDIPDSIKTCGDIACEECPIFTFSHQLSQQPSHPEYEVCYYQGCNLKPFYHLPFHNKDVFSCPKHKTEGMAAFSTCMRPRCVALARYNFEGEAPVFCVDHKEVGMELAGNDGFSSICEQKGCNMPPSYNFEGREANYCHAHKFEGMIRVVKTPRCLRRKKGSKKQRTQGMVNLVGNKAFCMKKGCKNFREFNYPGKKRKFCGYHKLEGMVSIKKRFRKRAKCEYAGCQSNSQFNFPGIPDGIFCSEHKEDGMIDVIKRQCHQEGCMKRPSFNFPGLSEVFCATHKIEGMMYVKKRQHCEAPNCLSLPRFNYQGSKAKFCGKHKEEGMVNLMDKTIKCASKDCDRHALYNIAGGKPRFCSAHMEKGMKNVRRTKKDICEVVNCKTVASFNFEGIGPGRFCELHKLKGMQSTINSPKDTYI